MTDLRPIWWPAAEGDPPDTWQESFEALTGDELADRYGLAAGVFISRVRRRTGRGPTFTELFGALFPDDSVHPDWPAGLNYTTRVAIRHAFRLHVAIQWKRRGWISWDQGMERSLRVGRVFRERSRERQAARAR